MIPREIESSHDIEYSDDSSNPKNQSEHRMNRTEHNQQNWITKKYSKESKTIPKQIPKIGSDMSLKEIIVTPKIHFFCRINRTYRYDDSKPSMNKKRESGNDQKRNKSR